MASRAILRRKRYLINSLNQPTCLIRGSSSFEREQPSQSNDLKSVRLFASQLFATTRHRNHDDVNSVPKTVPSTFRVEGAFRHNFFGINALSNKNGMENFVSSMGFMWYSQSIRYNSTAAAGQPEFRSSNHRNEQQISGQKTEASPEECDQAVEGLSTVKAKAKAKQIQDSQKSAKSVMMRMWAKLLGVGPALKAVASMSRF